MAIYIIETILFMLAAIGTLLIGFDMLSNNITKLFHAQLKKLFNKTSKNAIVGVLIGAAATAIVQSSGATTIMIVGFVNTGIINLFQATSMIMGANIGTTITAQIASLSGMSFDFGAMALGLTGIGALLAMFTKKEKVKTICNLLAGFGLLFLGLECMSLAIANEFEGTQLVKESIKSVLSNEFISTSSLAPFLLFFLGIIFTGITQSSSLITSLVISFVVNGIYIGAGQDATSLNNNVLFLILGSNIGSCVTAMISSMGATTNAKRASIIHLMFNVTGSIIFAIFLLIWKDFMEVTFANWFDSAGSQIAMFHTFFNVVCTIIFLPFINVFVKLANLFVKDKNTKLEETGLKFIDERLLPTPSIAVHQVRRELELMYNKSVGILNLSVDGFTGKNVENHFEVDKVNEELYGLNKQVIEFMVKLSSQQLVLEDESTLSSFHRTLNDILRIGEIAENICRYTNQTINNSLEFSSTVMLHIGQMKDKINELFLKTDEIFMSKDITKLSEADIIEDEIDNMRKKLIDDHMDRLKRKECSPQNSGVYVNLVNNLERAADHMIYIAYSVKEAKEQINPAH